ncbi:unnamed protein product, partial [Scytosiphon promiscuus]
VQTVFLASACCVIASQVVLSRTPFIALILEHLRRSDFKTSVALHAILGVLMTGMLPHAAPCAACGNNRSTLWVLRRYQYVFGDRSLCAWLCDFAARSDPGDVSESSCVSFF